MRLSTIWSPFTRGYTLRERLNRTGELAVAGAARHLPKRLAYWSFIHLGVQNIESGETVPDVPYVTVLSRIGKRPRPEPLLGCATTLELIEELKARAEVSATVGDAWPHYRTVDSA